MNPCLQPRIPVSTYRLQFNAHFTFSDAREVVPFLHALGITDIYASPYFKARRESLHGYDIVDPNALNPEVGTEQDYDGFVEELRKRGMGQILDIVPNHMGIEGNENAWWMDILENGPSSPYASFFDIDWAPVKRALANKVLIPVLSDQYGRVLERQDLRLFLEGGAFSLSYFDHVFPILPESYPDILRHGMEELKEPPSQQAPHWEELLSIITALNHLPRYNEPAAEKVEERYREIGIIKKRLAALYRESPDVRALLDENIRQFNGEKGKPRSFDKLDALLGNQIWRLSHWRVATEEINYRRFFDINSLAAIRVENPAVFKETHRTIFRLIREGKVTGLRVDHPDGLYDPSEYFQRLQEGCFMQARFRCERDPGAGRSEEEDRPSAGFELESGTEYREILSSHPQYKPFYIVGEKILSKGEKIPEDWPIFSTIGYAFLNPLNGIFLDGRNAKAFDEIYRRFTKSKVTYPDLVYEKKKAVIHASLAGEINTLSHYLSRISEEHRQTRDFTLYSLRTAITEIIACFTVYRTYVSPRGVNDRDRRYIEQAVSKAKRKAPALSATVFDWLEDVLLLRYPEEFTEDDKGKCLDFAMRFQQVTGPVMAKGLEDTVFYVYNRFVSLNEVGGNPEKFGTSIEAFHGQNVERSKLLPYSLIATATHDTKRGEDTRARLNVLSEIPEAWKERVARWSRANRKRKSLIDGQWVPDRNEEYLFYQTLAGIWPALREEAADKGLEKRVEDYMLKAIREAKVNTSWVSPNRAYEEAVLRFITEALCPSSGSSFLSDFKVFQGRLAYLGVFNSLSQTLLKITSPGVPDFYQGTELWDLSLVDPDNRRPVDYGLRQKRLSDLTARMKEHQGGLKGLARDLLGEWRDGTVKLYVTLKSLNYRRENPQLFREGAYIPVTGDETAREHLCAFARRWEKKAVLIVVPRFLARLLTEIDALPLGEKVWGESSVEIPEEIGDTRFENVLTGEEVKVVDRNGGRSLALKEVFSDFPVALLEGKGAAEDSSL